MNVTIEPGLLCGSVTPPPSKSHVHRLLIAAALAQNPTAEFEQTIIVCPKENADIAATIRCMEAMNCVVNRKGDQLQVISSADYSAHATLDCGESGSTLRFFLPICAACNFPDVHFTLTGRGRLPQRPNGPLLDEMRKNGAMIMVDEEARKRGEELPVTILPGMNPGEYDLPGNISSQYFTGLLFALPLLSGESTLRYTSPLESMPYVNMTLSVLRQFGIEVVPIENGWRIPGKQRYCSPGQVEAEGDWSSAAFWETANLLGSAVTQQGLRADSVQGDRRIGRLLQRIGGEIDVTDTPDLMPVLSIAAAATLGKTEISGAARLRIKESDRLSAMAQVIRALGGKAEEKADGLIIQGGELQGGVIDGMNDHRVVMSAAIAATVCRNPVTILGAEAADKSYPGFFEDFARLGGKIHVG